MATSVTSIAVLVGSMVVCLAIAALGAKVTVPEIPTWYASLNKPSWTPPRIAFPIVWPILYFLMSVAVWRLWGTPEGDARTAALIGFVAQLALNAIWSPIFFGRHDLTGGMVVISLLVLALAFTIFTAFETDLLAGLLLVPYLVWICFAAALNARILMLN